MKNSLKSLSVILLVAGLTLTGCLKKADNAPKEQVIPVKVMSATAGKVTNSAQYAVTIEPAAQADLSAKMGGKVVTIPVELGSYVQKGQVLVKLDSADAENALRQAEAGLASAKANLNSLRSGSRPQQISMAKAQLAQAEVSYEIAVEHHERMLGLYKQKLISKQQYEGSVVQLEQARSGLKSAQESLSLTEEGSTVDQLAIAEAGVQQAEAAVAAAKTQLENTVILSPVSGYVTMLNIHIGEMASPGIPIVSVADLNRVYAVANVGQSVIALLKKGTPAPVIFELNGQQMSISGEVEQFALAANPNTKTYEVKILLPNQNQQLKGGMVGKASFSLQTSNSDSIVLPEDAVLNDDGRRLVYIVEGEQAVIREVTLGVSDGTNVEITSGIKPEEKVVISGQHQLKPSSKVEVK
jgi:HlyD family secretion protein